MSSILEAKLLKLATIFLLAMPTRASAAHQGKDVSHENP
jgi:hypothetical protein